MDKVIVRDSKGNKRIVQRSFIPQGFTYVEDYKEPKKSPSKQKSAPKKAQTKKPEPKKEQPKKEDKK